MSQYGIGHIINKTNGKTFIFKSKNLTKSWENYHALLNENYHHNNSLQKDWNELGSDCFVFEIKEIVEENDDILTQKFNYYIENNDNIYNNFILENIPFDYIIKILTDELYNIIGESQINPLFLNKLATNYIGEEYYPQIKNEALSSINNGEVKKGEVDNLLDNIISDIIKNKKIEIENRKEKQFKELYGIIGENELSQSFLDLLKENDLSSDIGLEIKSKMVDLINNNLNESVDVKINELINEQRNIHDKQIESELLSQLHDLTGELDLTQNYVDKLYSKGLTPETGFIIRQNIKKQIQNGEIKDEYIKNILDKALDDESKRLTIENENKLIKYLYDFCGKDSLSTQFKSKLDIFSLNYEKGYQIKEKIYSLIKSHEITETSQIDTKIDDLIENEVIKETENKNKLFEQLYDIIGENQLNEEFKSKLKSYNIDDEWGISLLNSLKNDINTYNVKEDFDFKTHIDNYILDKKQMDLSNSLDEIFNSEELYSKLNTHFLNDDDAENIKSDLMEITNSENIETIVNLENNLDKEINNRINDKYNSIKGQVLDLRENLLADLYQIYTDEYVPKIKDNTLSEESVNKIKTRLEDVIKKDEIIDEKFNYKIDELNSLKEKTVKIAFKLLLDEEKRIENEKLNKLRSELKEDLSKLCENNETSFLAIKLKEYELPQQYIKRTENKVIQLIDSQKVSDKKFDSKLEELTFYKENSLKDEIEKVLSEFKKSLDDKLDDLYKITGKEKLNTSFLKSLSNKGLNQQAGLKIKSEIEQKIINDKITTNIQSNVNNRLNKMEIDKNESLQLVDENIGIDAKKFSFSRKLFKYNLDSDIHGMSIKNSLVYSIESGNVNPENFDEMLEKEINNEIKRKNERLKDNVDKIIGLNDVNSSFASEISQYNLKISDAILIRTEILSEINNNTLKEDEVENKINELIINKGNKRTLELLISNVNDMIGERTISQEFSQRLSKHDLDNSDGQDIKNKIIKEINNGKITSENLEESIEMYIILLDKDYVKNELNKLSSDQIDSILKKHSMSTFLPFKSSKINKLLDNVSLSDLKFDLAEYGNLKYKLKYSSNYMYGNSEDKVNNFCTNCGEKLDKGAVFCSSCGTKIN